MDKQWFQFYIPPEANESWTPVFSAAFTRIFHQHFPNAKIDFDDEAYWTYYTIIEMSWPAWKHEDLGRQLDEIERALRVLSRVRNLPWLIAGVLFEDARFRSRGVETDPNKGKISPNQAMMILPTLDDLLAPSLRKAKKLVWSGYQGKTNWEAANAIDGCRLSWQRCTGDEAPVSLKPGSSFGNFVRDIFNAIGIDGTPRAAMQAWSRVQSKDENT